MQLKSKTRSWTAKEKNLALSLYYKSPSAYKFLRLQKVNLSVPSTIRHWIGESKFLPGFSKSFLKHIKKNLNIKVLKKRHTVVCLMKCHSKSY